MDDEIAEVKIIKVEYDKLKQRLNIYFEYRSVEYMYSSDDVKGGKISNVFKKKFIDTLIGTNYEVDYNKNYEEFGYNKNFINKLTYGTETRIYIRCTRCGNTKTTPISCKNMSRDRKTVECEFCGNTNSYPERYLSNILNDLDIKFCKKTFDWSNGKQYDFYFELQNNKYIVETNGMQHYSNITNFNSFGGRSLEDEKDNDILKENMTRENNIDHYIVLDCRHSNPEWIKNSIINSELNNILELKNVDWEGIAKKSEKSIVLEICRDWNSTPDCEKSTVAFANKYNTNDVQIRRYLKRGAKIGLCKYDLVLLKKNTVKKTNLLHQKYRYICSHHKCIKEFKTVLEIVKYYNASLKIVDNIIKSGKEYSIYRNKTKLNLSHLVGLKIIRIKI